MAFQSLLAVFDSVIDEDVENLENILFWVVCG